MTKQEEIKGELAKAFHDIGVYAEQSEGVKVDYWDAPNYRNLPSYKKDAYEEADRFLKYLHSQGVVIKIDKELPKYWFDRGEGGYTEQHYIPSGLQECLEEAGYTAFKSLVE